MLKSGAKENNNKAIRDESKGLFYDLDINRLKNSLNGRTSMENIFNIVNLEKEVRNYFIRNQDALDQEQSRAIKSFLNELNELAEIMSLTPWVMETNKQITD